ncbi:MAG: acetyl-CoA carboxylase biotin carboxyl carrier protein [candidate division Zixibacteria bacterium]|nr:acetyl-CoA carboxylase biotin carboxyl carrier protein [candidate division Zixibacteria bacterium]
MLESKIRKLIRIVEESNIDELEVTTWGRKIRITRRVNHQNPHSSSHLIANQPSPSERVAATPVNDEPAAVSVEVSKPEEAEGNLTPIKSPMVGTFYRAPAPGAKPYVEAGQIISAGQVVCVVEAMKLMNEIESEVAGRVVKILVENGKPIEFGQTLFLIEPL